MGKSDVRCPKCGKATNEVELIYPRTDKHTIGRTDEEARW